MGNDDEPPNVEDDGRRSVTADELAQRVETGRVLRAWRKKFDISQDAVARHLGVGQGYVVKLEKGEKPLPLKHLWSLGRLYARHPGDLLKHPDDLTDAPQVADIEDPKAREMVADLIRRYTTPKK